MLCWRFDILGDIQDKSWCHLQEMSNSCVTRYTAGASDNEILVKMPEEKRTLRRSDEIRTIHLRILLVGRWKAVEKMEKQAPLQQPFYLFLSWYPPHPFHQIDFQFMFLWDGRLFKACVNS
ncbi:hypothetical protein LOAG_03144 [Loa loa]|uniref:Uncharacterized protein n=1 Tax=Loa loa TaxID=7209 RepID=A0A1S0U5C2_LOALO|nr:hypothetical protein LOAG_03144 [Loa loa]EFO25349.1 hypothetical protein LOAG_03144 [Loa loa]